MKSTYTARYRVLIDRLVTARKDAAMTQAELAGKLGRPQSYIAKIENAERRLDVVEMIDIAEQLGANPADLIDHLGSR